MYVEAEILRSSTPLEVCRLAAGQHQTQQRDVQIITVSDMFQFFVTAAKEKMERLNTPYFTEKETGVICKQLGLLKFVDRQGNLLSEKQAVWQHPIVTNSNTIFGHRWGMQ